MFEPCKKSEESFIENKKIQKFNIILNFWTDYGKKNTLYSLNFV